MFINNSLNLSLIASILTYNFFLFNLYLLFNNFIFLFLLDPPFIISKNCNIQGVPEILEQMLNLRKHFSLLTSN